MGPRPQTSALAMLIDDFRLEIGSRGPSPRHSLSPAGIAPLRIDLRWRDLKLGEVAICDIVPEGRLPSGVFRRCVRTHLRIEQAQLSLQCVAIREAEHCGSAGVLVAHSQ
jgi:hypothetical protein